MNILSGLRISARLDKGTRSKEQRSPPKRTSMFLSTPYIFMYLPASHRSASLLFVPCSLFQVSLTQHHIRPRRILDQAIVPFTHFTFIPKHFPAQFNTLRKAFIEVNYFDIH